ncbi:hypothetical protein CLOM_g19570 [Closterium sp. NIES-68]|nr:hypothetical protein CLOM_g19570 [Closterium sp. NIES-68]GJP84930.1 hypothetical protein CLOP_g14973 [Closterium sp. NIES-67]
MTHSLSGGGGGSRAPSFLLTWAVVSTTASFTLLLLIVVHMLSPASLPSLSQTLGVGGSGDPNQVLAGQVSRVQMAWGDRQGQQGEGEGEGEGERACKNWIHVAFRERGIPNTRKWSPWLPPLSPCRVQGLPIEAVEPDLNFRRGFTLGYVDYEEDKLHVLPYLRAALDHRMHRRGRRVFIDFGANGFHTSVTWFLTMYPLEFTEVHAFEIEPRMFVVPQPHDELLNTSAMTSGSRLRPRGRGPAPIPGWMLERIRPYNTMVGLEDNPEKNSINATRWLLEELRVTPEDTVVVKMDIEGAEWTLLDAWLGVPGLEQIIDELFVEVHYHHETMLDFHWYTTRFNATREEAAQLFNRLRAKGFYAHAWP